VETEEQEKESATGERCHVQWSTTDVAVPCQGGERRSLGADVAGATVARRIGDAGYEQGRGEVPWTVV
jgi:hypothetical protein